MYAARFFVVVLFSLLSACSDYPKDVENTLDSIKGSILHVGLIENPPWVIATDGEPKGVEPEIIQQLADKLNAQVRWHWGSTAEMLQALEQNQVYVVVGGLITKPKLPKIVTSTQPYYTTRYTVGFPHNMKAFPDKLKGETIALPHISPVREILLSKKAILLPMENPESEGFPVAGPVWRLQARAYNLGPWMLLKQQHVMAVAKGENAWISVLQRHLNGLNQGAINERLRQLEVLND